MFRGTVPAATVISSPLLLPSLSLSLLLLLLLLLPSSARASSWEEIVLFLNNLVLSKRASVPLRRRKQEFHVGWGGGGEGLMYDRNDFFMIYLFIFCIIDLLNASDIDRLDTLLKPRLDLF